MTFIEALKEFFLDIYNYCCSHLYIMITIDILASIIMMRIIYSKIKGLILVSKFKKKHSHDGFVEQLKKEYRWFWAKKIIKDGDGDFLVPTRIIKADENGEIYHDDACWVYDKRCCIEIEDSNHSSFNG